MEGFDEILKWAVEGTSGGIGILLAYYLFKRFIKKEVLEPIEEIKDLAKKAYKSAEDAKDTIKATSFSMLTKHQEVQNQVVAQMISVEKSFSEMSRQAATARIEVGEVKELLKSLKKGTEEDVTKLTLVGRKLFVKVRTMETEVKKISDELVMVKTKVEKK